jgi:basic membrane protein A and related proteins
MTKTLAAWVLTLTLSLTGFAAEQGKLPVVMVTDVAGLGDQGFNDAAWAGIKRAADEFGLKVSTIQSRDQADYVANLAAAAEKAKVVVSVGFIIADATKRVAPKYPSVHFIQIEGTIESVPNVVSYDFKSEEAGFLAGVVAALYTKTGMVGAVSGMEIPPVEAYSAGYMAGAKAVRMTTGKAVDASILAAGTFNDPIKGKSLAESLISKGADVIFRIAGNTGVGAWEAVKAHKEVKMIWEDIDRDATAPGQILASTLKRIDNAVFEGINASASNQWKSGHYLLGYREGGIGLSAMKESRRLFSAADLAMIERAKELLASGEVTVPTRRADVADWPAPTLKPRKAPTK